MLNAKLFVCLFVALVVITALAAAGSSQSGVPQLALLHVTVIDGTGSPPKPDMTVIIAGYRIAEIAKSNTISIPRSTRTIDATGSFLIPGLWDMHAHPDDPELWPVNPAPKEKDKLLTLLIANGVTGIRDMGGDLKLLQDWRVRVGAGTMIGLTSMRAAHCSMARSLCGPARLRS